MKLLLRTKARKTRAQSTVEFALVLPLLLLLLFGIIEFGRLLLFYSSVVSASREGARYGSASGDVGGFVKRFEDCTGIRAAAKKVGFFAALQDTDIVISYDHGPDTGELLYTCSTTQPDWGPPRPPEPRWGDRIVVFVSTTFEPIVPLIPIEPFTLSSTSARTIFREVEIEGTPATPWPTITRRPTNTPTPTETPKKWESPTPTETPTNTPTNTPTITPTITETPTLTPSGMPTSTETSTPTLTPTPTETPTPTQTPTPTITPTPVCQAISIDLLYTKRTVEGSISGELRWRINNPSSLVNIRLESLAIRWPNTSPAIKLYQTLIDGSTELWSSAGQIPPSYNIDFSGNDGNRTFGSEATRALNVLFTRNLVVGHYNLLATFRNISNDTTCTTSTGGYLAAPP